MKQLLPEIPLRLGRLEARVRASIRKPWLREVRIVRWHHQFLDATDLLVDESPQLCRAIVLGGRDASRDKEKRYGED
jgi:hypothetical protein